MYTLSKIRYIFATGLLAFVFAATLGSTVTFAQVNTDATPEATATTNTTTEAAPQATEATPATTAETTAENTVISPAPISAKPQPKDGVCTVNGKPVDCDTLWDKMKGYVGGAVAIIAVLGFFWLISLVFWVVMLIHAIRNDIENKVVWIVVMVIFGIFGALVYYFAEARPFNKRQQTQTMPGASQPGAASPATFARSEPLPTTPGISKQTPPDQDTTNQSADQR